MALRTRPEPGMPAVGAAGDARYHAKARERVRVNLGGTAEVRLLSHGQGLFFDGEQDLKEQAQDDDFTLAP